LCVFVLTIDNFASGYKERHVVGHTCDDVQAAIERLFWLVCVQVDYSLHDEQVCAELL